MDRLDALNVVCITLARQRWPEGITKLYFTGFKANPYDHTAVAQIYAKVQNSGQWAYSTVVLDLMDLESETDMQALLIGKFEAAIESLNRLVEDPFDRWVREVRKEHAKEAKN